MVKKTHEWPNREMEEAYTLPSRYYYDPQIMEGEKQQIFYRDWRLAAHVSEVAKPRQFVTCEIFDQSILIVRGDDNVLRAFHNVCQHRGTRLVGERRGEGKRVFVCKYHSWAYGANGSLIGAPRTERLKNFNKADICLPSVRVQEFAGFVFINLDENAGSMEDTYPGADELILEHASDMANLKFESEYDFIAPVNWKVVMHNNIESYHLTPSGPAHMKLARMVDFENYHPRTHNNWWVLLGPEDVDLNLSVQQGLKSFGFDQDRYMIDPERSCESEHAVHYFHTLAYAALNS